MFGNYGACSLKNSGKLTDRLPVLAKQAKNLPPGRIGDSPENDVALFALIRYQQVTKNRNQKVTNCQEHLRIIPEATR